MDGGDFEYVGKFCESVVQCGKVDYEKICWKFLDLCGFYIVVYDVGGKVLCGVFDQQLVDDVVDDVDGQVLMDVDVGDFVDVLGIGEWCG